MAKTVTKARATEALTPWEEQNRQVAYRAAVEGIVLLENDGALPLGKGRVALFGAGGAMTCKGGTGSGEVNERHSVTIEEGLEQAGFTVATKPWLDAYRLRYAEAERAYGEAFRKRLSRFNITEVINLMQSPFCAPVGQDITQEDIQNADTDTCLYVVTRQAGEGSDRKLDKQEYSLTEAEREQIALCACSFARFVLVLNVGGPFDLEFLNEIPGIRAVVFYAQQGGMGGLALADLLSGKHTPSGKLADSWAKRYDDLPFARDYSYLNGNLEQEYYREGIYVGYRYFDTFGVAPRYPFGYGLSYTQFAVAYEQIAVEERQIALQVRVTNTGTFAGKETVQLYVACPQTVTLPKEAKRLVAFEKTAVLQPGEEQKLTLRFAADDLASYREADAVTVLEQGNYVLHLGNSSRNLKTVAAVRVKAEQILRKHKPLCVPAAPVEELSAPVIAKETQDLPVMELPDIPAVTYDYREPAPKELDVPLTKKQQAQLCVGGGMFSFRHYDAPGAAGVTTGKLLKQGIPQRSLADGPAGVRLQQQSVRLKNGHIKPVEPALAAMKYLPDFIKKFLCADPKQGQVLYQFTTAFPVELALAQTWNKALLEEVGRAVGAEMEAYGVGYWLAPALNIHRNPLCGRNFEYYSEDPLLSGQMAAAVTKGVQSVPGRFVTIKHFACNNQEDNRNRTNANVSQRVLREIYLRGFEIAVKEGKPEAVMSSYNKLNGVYTPNSHDLLTDILRCEWGFEGFVMTDWLSTGRGLADDGAWIAAGNDLIMPGGSGNVRHVLAALRRGKITPEQLRRCAANVLCSLRRTKPDFGV